MDPVSQAAWDRLAPMLQDSDRAVMRLLLPYFNRNSLFLARVDEQGEELACEFANDCERLVLSITELRQAHTDLRAGRRLDWSAYRRLK